MPVSRAAMGPKCEAALYAMVAATPHCRWRACCACRPVTHQRGRHHRAQGSLALGAPSQHVASMSRAHFAKLSSASPDHTPATTPMEYQAPPATVGCAWRPGLSRHSAGAEHARERERRQHLLPQSWRQRQGPPNRAPLLVDLSTLESSESRCAPLPAMPKDCIAPAAATAKAPEPGQPYA